MHFINKETSYYFIIYTHYNHTAPLKTILKILYIGTFLQKSIDCEISESFGGSRIINLYKSYFLLYTYVRSSI